MVCLKVVQVLQQRQHFLLQHSQMVVILVCSLVVQVLPEDQYYQRQQYHQVAIVVCSPDVFHLQQLPVLPRV